MKQQKHTTERTETETISPNETDDAGGQAALPFIDTSPATAGETMTLTETLALLETENRDLKNQIRIGDARAAMTAALAEAGARSPELLFQVIKDEIEFNDDGSLGDVAALVDRLKEAYPEQFQMRVPASIDAGAGQAPAQRLTRSALEKMKPAEIAELDWADVRRALAAK